MKAADPLVMRSQRYLRPRRDAKGKAAFSSDSKLTLDPDWNESKNPAAADQNAVRLSADASVNRLPPPPPPPPPPSPSPPPPLSPSAAIHLNRIARTIRCGMAAAAPAQGPAVVAGIAGDVRSEVSLDDRARWAAVLSIASSVRSRSATCRRPRSRMPSSRSSSFPLAPNRCRSPLAHRKSARRRPHWSEMWRSRSLIIQVKCGTFTLTDRFLAVLAR